jgi:ATP-dependent exoDNAse (exonuclease V) alpha subunit
MTQSQALNILKTGVNVFLTGSAGSGKTHVLNQYIEYLKTRDVAVAVTASTGIAATHMNGMTIHSWSGLGIRETLTDRDIDELEQKSYLWKRFEKAKVLLIDEVSMLHGHRLDMIDRMCRNFKRNESPFGGLQIVLSGDFFQLPPVTRNRNDSDENQDTEESNTVYNSPAWKEGNFVICYLTEQHRQDDQQFLDVLNGIRAGTINESVLSPLRTRYQKKVELMIEPTKLYTHNADVDMINKRELEKIEGVAKKFFMSATGNDRIVDILKKSVLAHEELILKIGAKVMFVKNNFEAGYANGTLGVITAFLPDNTPVVKTARGEIVHASPVDWAIEEDGKVKASVTQIPLRYAWAITIHKSQGMSLDAAEIDLSKSFSYGMGYVALSRVRTLAGVCLVGMHADALRVDPEVLVFDRDLQERSAVAEEEFSKVSQKKLEEIQKEFILKSGGTLVFEKIEANKKREAKRKGVKNAEPKQKSYMATKELLDRGATLEEIAKERGFTFGTIVSHLEILQKEGLEFDKKKIKIDKKLLASVKKALIATGETKLTPLKDYLHTKMKVTASFDEIRLARLFV